MCGASVMGERRDPDDQVAHFVRSPRGRTDFQEVLLWNMADAGLAAPIVVVDQRYRFVVSEQLEDIGVAASCVILEPSPHARGTAAGLAMAALWLRSRDPGALMLVQPVDHAGHVSRQFHEAFALSLFSAHSGNIVSFGFDDPRRSGGNLFLMGPAPYLTALRTKYPKLLHARERSFEGALDGLGYLRPGPMMSGEPVLSVEEALEGLVDIALRVSIGDARNVPDAAVSNR
jgi:hypothetical protein